VLPLEVRKLRAEAVELHSRAVLSGPGVQPPRGRLSGDRRDPLTDIVRRLDGLEEKVDMVLALLLRQERHEARGRSTPLELHGEGLRFHWHEPLAESESIELEVALNLLPAHRDNLRGLRRALLGNRRGRSCLRCRRALCRDQRSRSR
jgi:hypothetical protein